MADEMKICPRCRERKYIGTYGDICYACWAKSESGKSVQPLLNEITLTTETYLDLKIVRRIGVITAECAYGMNIFKDIFASVRNIVGGRSDAVQKTMRDARETVLNELKHEAHRIGANAVIAIDLDYTQIGDQGWNMILLVASGTAVIVEDKPQEQADS